MHAADEALVATVSFSNIRGRTKSHKRKMDPIICWAGIKGETSSKRRGFLFEI